METIIIRKLKGVFIGLKSGTKKPEDCGSLFTKLKQINIGFYEELMNEYKIALKVYNDRQYN